MGVERGVDVRAGVVAGRALFLVLLLEVRVEGDAHVAMEEEGNTYVSQVHKVSFHIID